jgi:DNA-directed RNA polymerase specialized sigma subunit
MAVENMVKKLPKLLNKKEIYVIKGILKGKTQTDISVELKLSKVRISQLQASAFQKIRNSPMAGYLKKLIK